MFNQLNARPDISPPNQQPGRKLLKRSYLLAGMFFFHVLTVNGGDNLLAGARSLALSHASVSFSDVWAAFHNQAGLADAPAVSAGFYFESKFGIDELSLSAGSLVCPAGNGAFGISFYQFGKGAYRENKYALAYARQLSPTWSGGLQLDYFTRLFPENGRATGVATFEAGILFRASSKLHLGAHAFNPLSGYFDTASGKQSIPQVFRIGGHYAFDASVLVAWEAEKNNLHPVKLKSGIEFLPAGNLVIRLGVAGKPFTYTAGFGYHSGRLSADMGFGYHNILGLTPSLSVQLAL